MQFIKTYAKISICLFLKGRIQVRVCFYGASSTKTDPEYIKKVAELVDTKMKEIGSKSSYLTIIVYKKSSKSKKNA